ncbi:hypothetical protein PRZ48_011028 [Zasmidium cellare]|uniref:Uncharacterized protein n=1 Tax=Zasmidium cellare TaxID=395010 RepID=A0ABR0EAT9_ZASCE|nr:hypothetical protein PRZ48_011028 [Zasmidium cellare]
MTLPEFALRYKDCTTEELIEFLRQRSGNLRRDCNRSKCVKKLKRLDRKVTFRFLDMAPELRNNVYELLLNHNDEDAKIRRFTTVAKMSSYTPSPASKAYPAILRTSREVYNEARGILYDQSVLFQTTCGRWNSNGTQLFQTSWYGAPWPTTQTTCHPDLRHIKHLTMAINLHGHEMDYLSSLILPALLEAFGTDNPLKTLKLVCSQQSLMIVQAYPSLDPMRGFRLLLHLPATTKLELVGFPAAWEDEIRKVADRPAQSNAV